MLSQHNSDERWDDEQDKENARRKFALLDTNGDERLDADELRAAFVDLHPNEARYARLQSNHMMVSMEAGAALCLCARKCTAAAASPLLCNNVGLKKCTLHQA